MQLIVSARKLDLTPDVKEYIQSKMEKITDFYDRVVSIRVEVTREEKRDDGRTFGCEVLLSIPGKQFRAEDRGRELFEAVDLCQSNLESQIKSHKEKMQDETRKVDDSILNGQQVEGMVEMENSGDDIEDEMIEYACEVCQDPMTLEEAIEQMNLIKHDFYVFTNKETGQTNTVYKKSDGRYGVIVERN